MAAAMLVMVTPVLVDADVSAGDGTSCEDRPSDELISRCDELLANWQDDYDDGVGDDDRTAWEAISYISHGFNYYDDEFTVCAGVLDYNDDYVNSMDCGPYGCFGACRDYFQKGGLLEGMTHHYPHPVKQDTGRFF